MLDPLVDASPWLLLASGAAFFLLMANALWPLRHPLLMFQSFLAGLTVRETAAHHLAWQVPFVGLLVVAGALREWLGEHHPYDVPEVLALPIVAGSEPYLEWISAQTHDDA